MGCEKGDVTKEIPEECQQNSNKITAEMMRNRQPKTTNQNKAHYFLILA